MPDGPDFQALVKAQKHRDTLPSKLTEMIILQHPTQTTQKPGPFLPTPTLEQSFPNRPSQYTSPYQSTRPTYITDTPPQVSSAQARTSQQSVIPPGSVSRILCDKGGQKIDPRVDALTCFIGAGRRQRMCYEFPLQVSCTWSPPPCRNAHGTGSLSAHRLNALQALAREIPCAMGNECQNWACCFGHRGPFGKRYNRKARCRFSPGMHVTDLKVVR